ncbi:helix-turn-helix domain-containing protein [Peribacillus kribbensis]|uniref:helix-turn-helix domain-containing protein n=1 Tax=Peribacillus kribbensis TaxID=356658 RepID=UPI00047BE206|nr:helix-turn-helix transcriptional regulator [Peribacillus kribbensis]
MLQGRKIRELRKNKNLTLKELAVQTGLSSSLLFQIERDLVDPTVTTFWKICGIIKAIAFRGHACDDAVFFCRILRLC